MDTVATEKKLREFLIDDMLKEEVRDASSDEQLDLDSLDQTELRVFLEEEFDVREMGAPELEQPLTTINEIISFISSVKGQLSKTA